MVRVALAGAIALTLAAAAPATAKDGDVIKRGECSGSSDWKLKLSPEDGRIEVEYEVDSNVVGQVWRVRIVHDGDVVFTGRRMTKAPSGSFELRIVEPNHEGTDGFRAQARNRATDEVCRGGASF
jgi:hypothetical protein